MSKRVPLVLLAVAAIGCGGPTLEIRASGLRDFTPDDPMPRFLLDVEFENPGTRAVTLIGSPVLHVRSIHTGGDIPVEMDPASGKSAPSAIAPGEVSQVTFDLWGLTNLYGRGVFPELRTAPGDLRFRIVVETDTGAAESDDWAFVVSIDPEVDPAGGPRL